MKPTQTIVLPLSLVLLAACVPGEDPPPPEPAHPGDAPAVTAERGAAGETCVVCGLELGPEGKAWQVKGRWIPLHDGECREAFLESPGTYLAGVQPRGALFAEDERAMPAPTWGWFLAGTYVLLGLVCGAFCVHLAWPRRRSAALWFVLGMIFNVLAIGALLAASGPVDRMPGRLRKIPSTSEPVPCPECGGTNHPAAGACNQCGRRLEAPYEPEARRTGP